MIKDENTNVIQSVRLSGYFRLDRQKWPFEKVKFKPRYDLQVGVSHPNDRGRGTTVDREKLMKRA